MGRGEDEDGRGPKKGYLHPRITVHTTRRTGGPGAGHPLAGKARHDEGGWPSEDDSTALAWRPLGFAGVGTGSAVLRFCSPVLESAFLVEGCCWREAEDCAGWRWRSLGESCLASGLSSVPLAGGNLVVRSGSSRSCGQMLGHLQARGWVGQSAIWFSARCRVQVSEAAQPVVQSVRWWDFGDTCTRQVP
jgi:hypothetical protein